MQWSLEQLRQFVATAECGSFSAAARQLGKAQSAVSTAVALLEADFGLELFDRSHRNAQLTPAGQLLLLEAREMLQQAQALDQRAQAFSAGQDATLALALDEALPYMAINTLVCEISEQFPALELTLLNGTATEVADYVGQGRAQIAVHFVRGTLGSAFEQCHVGTVAQGVFVATGHPLSKVQPLTRKHLLQYRQLLMHADDVHEVAYSPKVWRSDSFYSIAEMVADELGWAILPVNIPKDEIYRKPLLQVPCPSLTLPLLSVRMVWNRGRPLNGTARWVQERFAQLLQICA